MLVRQQPAIHDSIPGLIDPQRLGADRDMPGGAPTLVKPLYQAMLLLNATGIEADGLKSRKFRRLLALLLLS